MDVRAYGRADGHLRPNLLGRLTGVNLKIHKASKKGKNEKVMNTKRYSKRWESERKGEERIAPGPHGAPVTLAKVSKH